MVRLPPLWIGEGSVRKRFPLGTIRNIVNASRWDRMLRLRERKEEIFGVPTAWVDCVDHVGIFSDPERNLIARAYARGTSSKKDLEKTRSFNIRAELAKAELGQFRDSVSTSFPKTAILRLNYGVSRGHPPIEMSQIRTLFGNRVGVVEDGVIHYMHVKDGIKGTNFLWAKFTKRKHQLTKIWDKYAEIINELHKLCYDELKVASHLDIVAVHEDDDWFLNKDKAREAIENAYIEDYVMKKLYPMLEGTVARGVLYKRTEYPQPSAPPTEAEPLFPEGREGLETVLKDDQQKLNNYSPD